MCRVLRKFFILLGRKRIVFGRNFIGPKCWSPFKVTALALTKKCDFIVNWKFSIVLSWKLLFLLKIISNRDGDLYAALRDCYEALRLDPYYMKAHFRLARCLHELSWSKEACDCLMLFKHRFPDYAKSYTFQTLERDIKAAIYSQTEG